MGIPNETEEGERKKKENGIIILYEPISRDWQDATIPFEIVIKLLEAKKARIIQERDNRGRILRTEVPNYF